MDLFLSSRCNITSPAVFTSPSRPRLHVLPSRTLFPTPATCRRKIYPVRCRYSDYPGFQPQPPQPPQGWVPRPSPDSFPVSQPQGPPRGPGQSSKVFVGYSIYKGKAALTVEPRPPEFASLDSGAYKLSREGYVLLQFAPAVVPRHYDWTRKQLFSLSMDEIGTLMCLGPKDSCEIFHDPFKGKSEEGKIRKVLKVEPLPDGTGHYFNLSVQNRITNVDENIYIPVSRGEFTVLNNAFRFIIPYLLGWNNFADSVRPDVLGKLNNSAVLGADAEWSR